MVRVRDATYCGPPRSRREIDKDLKVNRRHRNAGPDTRRSGGQRLDERLSADNHNRTATVSILSP